MQTKEDSSFTISKTLFKEFEHEAKRRSQKLKDYIDDLVLALTCADSKVWEEA